MGDRAYAGTGSPRPKSSFIGVLVGSGRSGGTGTGAVSDLGTEASLHQPACCLEAWPHPLARSPVPPSRPETAENHRETIKCIRRSTDRPLGKPAPNARSAPPCRRAALSTSNLHPTLYIYLYGLVEAACRHTNVSVHRNATTETQTLK